MTKILGQLGEDLVARHYQDQGYRVIARNFIFPYGKQAGEIDLIVKRAKDLVFVEVKTRTGTGRFGTAFEAVNKSKQKRLIKTAKLFVHLNKQYTDYNLQIDVAGVDIDNLQEPVIIIPNAIEDPV